MEGNELLIGRMEDLAGKAVKTGCAASRFLTPAEAQKVAAHFARRRDAALSFDGGREGAERVRAVFLNPEWGELNRGGLFAALKITYHPHETLGHRDILGALMALGIERGTIGDIIAGDHTAALICLPEISGYIIENLVKAGRIGVSASGIALDELPRNKETLSVKTDTVASLRLDAVLGSAFGLPRGTAVEMILAGLVSLDYEICLQPAKKVQEGNVLSVRGLGRAILTAVGGVSKKGRIFISTGLYGQ